MIVNDSFERTVSVWLHADAEHRIPDHLEAVLRMTSVARQRPAWSSLERWLPMDTTFTGRVAPAFRPLGPLVIAALLVLALAAALLIAGSRTPRPAPYGPALTGLTVRSEGGDIYLVDPVSKQHRSITSGPEWDNVPVFSRDGTMLAFLRRTSEPSPYSVLFVAKADGSKQRPVSESVLDVSSGDWSGDGVYIAFTSLVNGISSITVVDVRDGSSKVLNIGMAAESASWLPPSSQEIVFRGVSTLPSGVYAIRPDGTGLRRLTSRDGAPETGYRDPVVSPDGRLLAYTSWDDNIAHVVHLRDLVSGSTWEIPKSVTFDDRTRPSFSPDGSLLLMYRSVRDGPPPDFAGVAQLVLATPDGSQSGIPLGPKFAYVESKVPDLEATFSTDGSQVFLLNRDQDELWTLPVDGRAGALVTWVSADLPGFQRVSALGDPAAKPCPGGGGCRP